MENVVPFRIQVISIAMSILFMIYIFRLVTKGRLREEYSIVWIICTLTLMLFAVWRSGLDVIAKLLGIFYAPSLVFLGAIFAIIIFLVHLSVVNSKLQRQIKDLAQDLALLKNNIQEEHKREAGQPGSL